MTKKENVTFKKGNRVRRVLYGNSTLPHNSEWIVAEVKGRDIRLEGDKTNGWWASEYFEPVIESELDIQIRTLEASVNAWREKIKHYRVNPMSGELEAESEEYEMNNENCPCCVEYSKDGIQTNL